METNGMEPGEIRVEQQNLNSRKRRKIARGLRRILTRMASLLRELRNGIKAEIEGKTRRHLSTFSESDEPMKNEELSTDGTNRRIRLALQ